MSLFGPIKQDIALTRGDSPRIRLPIKNVDLAGASFRMTVDPEENPANDTANVFSIGHETIDANGTDGGTVSFRPSTTDLGTAGAFFYDIQGTFADGQIVTTHKGKFTVLGDITK